MKCAQKSGTQRSVVLRCCDLRCIRIRLREKSHMCRKFGHGVGMVEGVETVIGPLEGDRSRQSGSKYPKMVKNGKTHHRLSKNAKLEKITC